MIRSPSGLQSWMQSSSIVPKVDNWILQKQFAVLLYVEGDGSVNGKVSTTEGEGFLFSFSFGKQCNLVI